MAALGNTLGLAGAAGTMAVLGTAAHHGFGFLRDRFTAMRRPSWDIMGQARAFGDHGGSMRYVRGQEALLKGMYEIPYDIVKNRATMIADSVLDRPGKMYNKYKLNQAFDKIKDDPSVRAMGVNRARDMYMDIGALAPDVVRKAPGTVIPAVQNAIMTDSIGLRPDFVSGIGKAQGDLFTKPRRR